MSAAMHPAAPHDLPYFISAPGATDWMMVNTAIFLVVAVLGVGVLFLRLHSLPERLAHNSQKLQFEIVAVLCLLSLFTHNHAFWVIALLLALIDLPDIGTPIKRIADALDRIAGPKPSAAPASPPARPEPEAGHDA
jgi:multisubunit Na+/H+ antiporter MnhF subunit